MNYEPQVDLDARYPHVQVELADLSPALAAVIPNESLILFSPEITPAQRRSSLAHEIAHLDLNHCATQHPWFACRQELEADILAATRLISLAALVELVGWCRTDRDIAWQLHVDSEVVKARRATLSQAETAVIDARVTAIEHAA